MEVERLFRQSSGTSPIVGTGRRQFRRFLGVFLAGGLMAMSVPSPAAAQQSGPPVDVWMNMEKTGDKEVICAGDSVTFTLITRLLGGAAGVELRNISATDSNLPGVTLVAGDQYFDAASDVGSDGVIRYADADLDDKNDEEFVWTYTLTYSETTVNQAADTAEVWFVDPQSGSETLVGTANASDEWTVTVDPAACPTTTTTTTTTTTVPETTTTSTTTSTTPETTSTSTTTTIGDASGGVSPTTTPVPPTTVFVGPLPATGNPTKGLAPAGLIILVAGGALMLVARRSAPPRTR